MNPLLLLHLHCLPASCRLCARTLRPPFAARAGEHAAGYPFLCADCLHGLPWLGAPLQRAAGAAGAGGSDQDGPNQDGPDSVWAALRYTHPIDRWVRSFKYTRQDTLAPLLGALLRLAPWQGDPLESVDWVIPVPLHRRRLWGRGFNQSLLLAHHWLGGGRSPVARRLLLPQGLRRTRFTRPQVGMDAAHRSRNLSGAFALGPSVPAPLPGLPCREALEGRTILLVDDVVTSGATLLECARVLRAAGAKTVKALVVAAAEHDGLAAAEHDGAVHTGSAAA